MNRAVQGLVGSPLRNLAAVVASMVAIIAVSTVGYVLNGWSLTDGFYMSILTVYSVGYQEVRPVDTPALHAITISLIVFGCTGMILLTGVLVQVFTVVQIKQLLGLDSVTAEIDRLKGHVIICGFGRIGVMLAKDLKDGGADIVILERDDLRFAQAQAAGYLALHADAADEAALKLAGIERARVLATVVPDDAANVFITLTARSLKHDLHIIARGEEPSTESKLLYAGADKVVLPTHIGAERMAEMILHPETARFIRGSDRMLDFDKTLRDLGLQLEVITVTEGSGAVGATIGDIEHRTKGGFFVVQLDRRNGEVITRPGQAERLQAGDGVLIVTRGDLATTMALFQAPAERVRAGRTTF